MSLQSEKERIAFRENREEDKRRIRNWAKGLTIERIKNLLTFYRADLNFKRVEIKILEQEEKRRKRLKEGLK